MSELMEKYPHLRYGGERLRYIRLAYDLEPSEFLKRIFGNDFPVSKEITRMYLDFERYSVPSGVILSAVCKELNVNYSWLKRGKGDVYNQNERSNKPKATCPFSHACPYGNEASK